MKERIQFLLLYYIFWLTYFICARIIFLAYHIQDVKQLTLEMLYGIFKNGVVMDLSAAAYLSVIPFLLVCFSHFYKKSRLESILYSFTFFMTGILTLIIVIDLEVYNVWKFRLDQTPLNYLSSPKEAFASASASPIFQLFISFLLLMAIASYFVYRIISHNLNKWKFTKKLPFIPIALAITVLLIIPIRGGLSGKTLKPGNLYFSDNYFVNISTLNSPWYFAYSLVKQFDTKLNPYSFLPKKVIDKNLSELFPKKSNTKSTPIATVNDQTNVLIVIVESLTEKALGKKVDGIEITPFLNSLRDSSVYFSNMYAAGSHTEEGLVAILNGFPSIPGKSLIYEEKKVAKLPFLTKDFDRNSFATSFYYGGDASFLNLKNYLLTADYQNITEVGSFPDSLQKSSWGVFDGELLNRFITDYRTKSGRPFFSTILTASSHEPFKVPGKFRFTENSVENQFYNSLAYVDESLKSFISNAQKQWWWKNTVVIIVADHGHRFPKAASRFDDYKIPMFWTGGAVTKFQKNNDLLSQIDISTMILKHFNFNHSTYVWSKNPLLDKQPKWAFFTFNNGFGYVEPSGEILFDNTGLKVLSVSGKNKMTLEQRGKTLQQTTYEDYLRK
ncbi:MAG: LTA synthase family protein [Spirosomaceae bacterium]|nr:LTA synthase family protein [Spirosomataceae bacterium]